MFTQRTRSVFPPKIASCFLFIVCLPFEIEWVICISGGGGEKERMINNHFLYRLKSLLYLPLGIDVSTEESARIRKDHLNV